MRLTETIPATPIGVQKSVRRDEKRVLTSSQAGKIVPLAYVPLLREDRLSRGEMRVRIEMMETPQTLMNAINVTCYAHFIPHLAFERFNGMDQFNRSYAGEPETEGGSPVPFFTKMPFNRNGEIFKVMGLHAKAGTQVNAAVVEAYNVLVNHRRRARSQKLPLRDLGDTTLAPAFWHHTGMAHIVPDFDSAMLDGEVMLSLASDLLPLRGTAPVDGLTVANVAGVSTAAGTANQRNYAGAVTASGEPAPAVGSPGPSAGWYSPAQLRRMSGNTAAGFERPTVDLAAAEVFAELAGAGVAVSLSNIELAKKTAAFAKLRAQYAGIEEDYLIDLLMQGVRVPEIALSQPILLDRKSTIVGYSKRYATDAANLDESVTTGETFVDMRMRTPPMNTGGIILITCEIVPEQLFERQKDYYLHASSVDDLPDFTADFLDPEKVSIVPNAHVDVDHDDPDGTFGYAPLNHEWQRAHVNIGGKYYRPEVDASFDEDRQKIWAVETPNPKLTEDFYMASNLHQKVFADTLADAFEYQARGSFEIVGNTVFGKGLQEATDDYEHIMSKVDLARIVQDE